MSIPGIAISLHTDALVGSDMSGATTVYVLPVATGAIDLYATGNDAFSAVPFEAQTSIPLDATNYPASKIYDVFAALDGSALFIGTGPAWTNATTRSAAIEAFRGRLVNAASITLRNGSNTLTVSARETLLVGGFATTLAGVTEDSRAKRLLWNAWAPVTRNLFVKDTAESWPYSTASWRQVRGSTANQVEYLQGLIGRSLRATQTATVVNSTGSPRLALTGIALDTVTNIVSDVAMSAIPCVNGAATSGMAHAAIVAPMGRHTIIMCECGAGADTQTWYGQNDVWTQTGLLAEVYQ